MAQDVTPLPRSRAAIDKLDRTIARLETALDRPKTDLFGDQYLDQAREEFARLKDTTREVEDRIGKMVDHLATLLKE